MQVKYRNKKDNQVYTIQAVPIKTKNDFGWQDCGTGNVLKAKDGTIYLLATLDRCPDLWEKIGEN